MTAATPEAPPITSPDGAAAEAADSIPVLRRQIDALDEALLRLVAERVRVSRRIQAARISAGGARVEIGRERVVHDTYRTALGDEGAELAAAVLQVCRGARA